MANELIVNNGNDLVEVIDQQGLDAVLEPLIKEIHLFDTFIAGTTHLKDPSVLEQVAAGDSLTLRREDNVYDGNAILVLEDSGGGAGGAGAAGGAPAGGGGGAVGVGSPAGGRKLGYIPEKDNVVFARLMDAGKLLKAKVIDKEQLGSFTKIRIGVYLVDF